MFNLPLNNTALGLFNQQQQQFDPQSLSTWGGQPQLAAAPQADAGFMSGIFNRQSMFGGQGSTGWVSPVLGGVGALAQGWMGMQQLKLGRENLAFQKEAWQKNYQNQVDMINTQMRDRQAARYSANPQQYQKPDEYMAENKVGR